MVAAMHNRDPKTVAKREGATICVGVVVALIILFYF